VSALADRIGAAKAEARAALIAYLPVGYPDVPTSIEAMVAAVEGGADIVEIGVPYSDPGMDGPVIQQVVEIAVRAGVGMPDVLQAVAAVHVEPAVRDYVTRIVRATREEPTLALGASPRASVALFLASRAEAPAGVGPRRRCPMHRAPA